MEHVGRSVAKLFPEVSKKKKFKGTVTSFDPNDKLAYHIMYEDGDEEDITEEELLKILVPQATNKRKKGPAAADAPLAKSSSAEPKGKKAAVGPTRGAVAAGGKKKAATGSVEEATAPEEDLKPEAPGDEAAAATGMGAEADAAAAAAAVEGGEGKAAAATAVAGGEGASKAKAGPSAKRGAGKQKATSPGSDLTAQAVAGSEALQELISDVVAKSKARALNVVRYRVAEEPAEGAEGEAASRTEPLRSQAVTCGSLSFISTIFPEDIRKIEGDPQPAEELAEEYKRQAQQVLCALEQQLKTIGSSKQHLVNVTVMLREVDKGTPPFGEVWNQWIDPTTLPAMFIFESYMDQEALVALTAQAAVPPQIF